jgi:hypothetical protein
MSDENDMKSRRVDLFPPEPKKVTLEEMLTWPKGTKLTDFRVLSAEEAAAERAKRETDREELRKAVPASRLAQ